jgi:hypothetical protein
VSAAGAKRRRRIVALLALLSVAPPTAFAQEAGGQSDQPMLSGTNATATDPERDSLLVFRGSQLLNEFVYRAVIRLPPNAGPNQETARDVAGQLAFFLGEAGYELASVRAQVKDQHIELLIDEGALDKIIVAGLGWLGALRFRAKLNLPLDVFNRRLFELQLPTLARQFGMMSYRYELWPVHLLGADNALVLEGMEELRAMPGLRPARGYELRIFAKTDPWGTGFSPEVILNGPIGLGIGGRYRWRDIIQTGDRWQWHFRLGGTFRSYLPPETGSRPVNTLDYVSVRWLSRSWDSSPSGLRMTVVPRAELWTLQRRDLMLESYRIGLLELPVGAGAQLTRQFALFFTLGPQRRFITHKQPALGSALLPEVAQVPRVSTRAFLRLNSQYTFNPAELRQDLHDTLALQLDAYQPTSEDRMLSSGSSGFFRFDLQGRWLFPLGWHELRAGAHLTGEAGNIWFTDELPLSDHLRIGFSLEKYTHRVASGSLEFRYSLLRDKVKVGVFNDTGVWRKLPRNDPAQKAELAGSFGASLGLFLFDEIQVDAYYGLGWSDPFSSTDRYTSTGLALAIKEAF